MLRSQKMAPTTHLIDNTFLDTVFDQHPSGTWTASWWYPAPMRSMDWAHGSGTFATREAAQAAAIEWARAHGPQR